MEARLLDPSVDQAIVVELALREDIGAELDDFLLLSLLGIDDEARESAREILWRHLRHFPVFAEIADYLIQRNDVFLKTQLLQTITTENIHFADPREAKFLATIVELLESERLLASRWREESSIMSLDFDHWHDPILCHLLEIKLTSAARNWVKSDDQFDEQVLVMTQKFLDRQMLTDAARCFSIVAAPQPHMVHSSDTSLWDEFHQTYLRILDCVNDAGGTQDGIEADENRKAALMTRMAYLELRDSPSCKVDGAVDLRLDETRQLLFDSFHILSDSRPRGKHVALYRRFRSGSGLGANMATSILKSESRPERFAASEPKSKSHELRPLPVSPAQQLFKSGYAFGTKISSSPVDSPTPKELFEPTELSETTSPSTPIDIPRPAGMSNLMKQFFDRSSFEGCFDFCLSHPEIFDEDIRPLQGVAVNYLRQGRRDFASRVIERRMMLRNATDADAIEYMMELTSSRSRQMRLAAQCKMIIEALEEALAAASTERSNPPNSISRIDHRIPLREGRKNEQKGEQRDTYNEEDDLYDSKDDPYDEEVFATSKRSVVSYSSNKISSRRGFYSEEDDSQEDDIHGIILSSR